MTSSTTEPVSDVDFADEPDLTGAPAPLPTTVGYDPSRDREQMRGRLGRVMIILIAVYALGITGLAAWFVRPFDAQMVSSLLAGVFTPLITVVGTVVGFYFGSSEGKPR